MRRGLLALAILALCVAPAVAQEELGPAQGAVANLEPGFPAVIADTTTTPMGAFEMGVAAGYVNAEEPLIDSEYFTALGQVNYGILEELQLTASWDWVVGEGWMAGNADTTLGLLWRMTEEGAGMPSLGLEVSGRLPTGDGFTGYDGIALGILSKTFGEVRMHVNAGYTTIGNSNNVVVGTDGLGNPITAGYRNDSDFFALGMDYPVTDDMVLILDISTREAPIEGAERIDIVEAGVRTALSDVDTLSVGIGVGVGPGELSDDLTAIVGYQREL